MGKPKPTCCISGLFPCRLLHSCCQPGCSSKAWTEQGRGWVFQSLELWSRYLECQVVHSWFGSLVCPVPGCSRRLLALPRDARRGTAIPAHKKAPRKAEAIWEAEVQDGKGSTVPEVNTSAVLALPEARASAGGVAACWAPSVAAALGTVVGSSRAAGKPAEGAG